MSPGKAAPESFSQPLSQQRKPLFQREEEAVIILIEYQLVANTEQKNKIFYLPVAGITSKKNDRNVKALLPKGFDVSPAISRFRMGQNPMDHGMAGEGVENLRPISAKDRIARIPEERRCF